MTLTPLKSLPPLKSIACVVISVDAPEYTAEAVDSLLSQSVRPEIVVVNSGGGDPFRFMQRFGNEIRVIHHGGRLNPGAARNLGIAATKATYIAFLACDCIAEPDWVRLRLEAHRDHEAVSSAVRNAAPANLAAVSSYLLLFPRRMPGTPEEEWLHYGVSYARSLFEQHGEFREDLRSGEDTEFHQRITPEVRIHRCRGVHTRHRHPTGVRDYLEDQYRRGFRARKAFMEIGDTATAAALPRLAWQRVPKSFVLHWMASGAHGRAMSVLALPLLAAGAFAYSFGAVRQRRLAPGHKGDSRSRPDIHALLQVRNGMRYLPGYLRNLEDKVAGVIVLDDGSTDGTREFAARSPLVTRLIANPVHGGSDWRETENRAQLIEAAIGNGARWVIALDVDERLPDNFPERLQRTLERARHDETSAFYVWLRELWNNPGTYRVDGIWGSKRVARLFDVTAGSHYDASALHGHWAPTDTRRGGTFVQADLEIFHLKMIHQADRRARLERYERLDPDHRWQSIGYRYLTDESGCVCRRIEGASTYSPLASGAELDPAPPKLYALLAFHNEARFIDGYLANVAPQVDGIIALDDGSTDGTADVLRRHPMVIELLSNPTTDPHVWDERYNQRRLLAAVEGHDPGWLVVIDADERLEKDFRQRANAHIRLAETRGVAALSIAVRELWGDPNRYRADGIWGNKRKASLFRFRTDHEFDPRPMHNYWAPLNSRVDGAYPEADLEIYHLRMLRPEDRAWRKARYLRMDPDARWQPLGYDYLDDETDLALVDVDPSRHFAADPRDVEPAFERGAL